MVRDIHHLEATTYHLVLHVLGDNGVDRAAPDIPKKDDIFERSDVLDNHLRRSGTDVVLRCRRGVPFEVVLFGMRFRVAFELGFADFVPMPAPRHL